MRVSVIVVNYNYERFLRHAIQSCLDQTYGDVETVVVDDGSSDNSQQVIGEFDGKVVSVYQENMGMMQAANHGLSVSTGDIIVFLDADDYLLEDCVERIVDNWKEGASKVHYRLKIIDQNGNDIGVFPPQHKPLGEGQVWKQILSAGRYTTPPTSGNAFSRNVLEKIFPVRDAKIGIGSSYYDSIPTDAYLKLRVPFYGPVVAIEDALGVYRRHETNFGANNNPYVHRGKRQRLLRLAKMNSEFIERQAAALGRTWDEDVLFTYGKFLKLRVLSFRFDGRTHPWPTDTRANLLGKALNNLTRASMSQKGRRAYEVLSVGLLCVMPYSLSRVLLRAIH